ncbi:hypothetical protein [Thermococcus aciditolerans]|uniref:Uncharacterized protein n=1 Tax=Thermococcus aciditolerans TaxID=2598455 RepID=A0A5C0SLX5_9EURY|nr:hypothetical protein [Thermococcus aciditolerans]QEK14168.1 hypothetical protein FPV09_02490 [Thermococcus aciditolerans]
MPHLFIVGYENDAERKRVEYLLDKWSNRARISKVRGISFIIDASDVEGFAEELLSKLDPPTEGKVRVYRVEPEDIGSKIAPNRRELEYLAGEEPIVVQKLLKYVLSKFGAYYVSSEGNISRYRAYTKKGRMEIEASVEETGEGTRVVIGIEGYGTAVDDLARKLEKELSLLL